MTKTPVFLALGGASGLALAHGSDLAHSHTPDGLTLILLALGAVLISLTLAGLLVWRQRRQARSGS